MDLEKINLYMEMEFMNLEFSFQIFKILKKKSYLIFSS